MTFTLSISINGPLLCTLIFCFITGHLAGWFFWVFLLQPWLNRPIEGERIRHLLFLKLADEAIAKLRLVNEVETPLETSSVSNTPEAAHTSGSDNPVDPSPPKDNEAHEVALIITSECTEIEAELQEWKTRCNMWMRHKPNFSAGLLMHYNMLRVELFGLKARLRSVKARVREFQGCSAKLHQMISMTKTEFNCCFEHMNDFVLMLATHYMNLIDSGKVPKLFSWSVPDKTVGGINQQPRSPSSIYSQATPVSEYTSSNHSKMSQPLVLSQTTPVSNNLFGGLDERSQPSNSHPTTPVSDIYLIE